MCYNNSFFANFVKFFANGAKHCDYYRPEARLQVIHLKVIPERIPEESTVVMYGGDSTVGIYSGGLGP